MRVKAMKMISVNMVEKVCYINKTFNVWIYLFQNKCFYIFPDYKTAEVK